MRIRTGVIAFTLFVLTLWGGAAKAEPVPWLKLDKEALAAWKATVDPIDANKLTLARGDSKGDTAILVIVPWPSSAYDTALSTILKYFADHGRAARFTVVNMDGNLARGQQELQWAESNGFKLVFAMGSEAALVAHESYRGEALPVVTVCAKDPVRLGQVAAYDKGSGTNIAYTSLNMPTDAQFSYLLQLMPDVRNIAILVDATNKSSVETQSKPLEEAAQKKGINALVLAVNARKGVREDMPRKMAEAIVAMMKSDPELKKSFFWVTGSTAVFTEMGIIDRHAGKVPVLSVVPNVVKAGDESAALAVGISFESNARLAAAYSFAILDKRAKPGELKVGVVEPPDIAINFKKARAAGLRIPYAFFELATYVYDADGKPARVLGRDLAAR
jgi:putative tryptophan/tyrosine transport system substrate-binding protein